MPEEHVQRYSDLSSGSSAERTRHGSVSFLDRIRGRQRGQGQPPAGRPPFSARQLALGAVLFVVLTLSGLGVVVWASSPGELALLEIWGKVSVLPLFIAAALACTEAILGGVRIQVLAGHVHSGFRWRDGMLVHFYNVFAAGVTPLQAGSGPAQYFVLRRKGLKGSRALAVLAVNWVGVMSGLVMMGFLALLYLQLDSGDFAVGPVFRGLLITVFAFGFLAVAVTLSPGLFGRSLPFGGWVRRSRRGRKILRSIGRYRVALSSFARGGKRALAANIALSWCMLLTRSLIGVAILAAIGVSADALSAMARQVLQFAIIYVTPSPGGSGVAELSTLGFMAGIVPPMLMATYALLWRAAAGYLAIVLGGFFVALDLIFDLFR